MTQPRKNRAAPGGAAVPRGAPAPRDGAAPNVGSGPRDGRANPQPPPVELRIPASSEYVRVVRLALTGVASRMAFTYNEVEDIKVAIAEACNNAILHASASAVDGPLYPTVLVTFRPSLRGLEICISDDGRLQNKDLLHAARAKKIGPLGAAAELPERGFGLLIIQTLMDEVELFSGPDGRTTLRMVKYLQTPRVDPRAA